MMVVEREKTVVERRESVRRRTPYSLDEKMFVERESVMRGDSYSLDKQFIIVQAQQTDDSSDDDDSTDDITKILRRRRHPGPRRFDTTGYYSLNLLTGDFSTLPRTVQDSGPMNSMVCLGSRIYIFGRQINNSDSPKPSSSYFLDLTNSQTSSSSSSSCWKRAHPWTTQGLRLGRPVVVFGGKMYFFDTSDDFSCFCKVFDPTQPMPHWRRINTTTPAGDLTHPVLLLADHKNDRIIVFFYDISSMYAYYPSKDLWECVGECFGRWFPYLEAVTLVDGVIYSHCRTLKEFFMAYDIATKEWLNVQLSPAAVLDYKSYLPLYSYEFLFHLGNGILCLLASTYMDRESHQPQSKTTLVHVVQFKVELINNNDTKEVLVTPLSSRYYDLDSRCIPFSCLAL